MSRAGRQGVPNGGCPSLQSSGPIGPLSSSLGLSRFFWDFLSTSDFQIEVGEVFRRNWWRTSGEVGKEILELLLLEKSSEAFSTKTPPESSPSNFTTRFWVVAGPRDSPKCPFFSQRLGLLKDLEGTFLQWSAHKQPLSRKKQNTPCLGKPQFTSLKSDMLRAPLRSSQILELRWLDSRESIRRFARRSENTLSTAGNSMTSSERPSLEPLLKKRGAPSRIGGGRENSGNALEASNALNDRVRGNPSRTLEGNSRKRPESVSGVFPEFLPESPSHTGGVA